MGNMTQAAKVARLYRSAATPGARYHYLQLVQSRGMIVSLKEALEVSSHYFESTSSWAQREALEVRGPRNEDPDGSRNPGYSPDRIGATGQLLPRNEAPVTPSRCHCKGCTGMEFDWWCSTANDWRQLF